MQSLNNVILNTLLLAWGSVYQAPDWTIRLSHRASTLDTHWP